MWPYITHLLLKELPSESFSMIYVNAMFLTFCLSELTCGRWSKKKMKQHSKWMYISRGEAVAVFGRSLWDSLPAGTSSVPVGVSSVTVRGCRCVWGIRLWQYGEKAFSKSPGWWLDCHRLPPSYQVGWISTNKLVLVQKRTRILGYLSHSIRNRDGIFSRGAAALGVAGSSLLVVIIFFQLVII